MTLVGDKREDGSAGTLNQKKNSSEKNSLIRQINKRYEFIV